MNTFTEGLNGFGRWLIDSLWRMSIELAILAAVVVGVICLLRIRSPRVRHLFWCLVLAKPVATFMIASPVSLYWFLRPQVERVEQATAAPELGGSASERPRPIGPRSAPRRAGAPASAGPEKVSLGLHGTVALAWMAVAAALALRLLLGFAYVTFLRQTARVQRDGRLAELAADASEALQTRRRVRIAISEVAHGPVLAGILRPVILLPRRLAEELSPGQMKLVVLHELAHLRRHDNLFLLIQRLAEMFLFFHPAVWVCGWAMRREAEAACDDAVLAACGDSAGYADSLTRVAEMRDALTRRLLVNTFAAAESDFGRRVRRILRGPVARTTLRLTVASVVALIAIGCLGLPAASKQKAAATDQAAIRDEEKAMPKKLTHSPVNVRREAGKVWIENVKGWGMGRKGSSIHAAQAAIMRAIPEDITYEQLVGSSGLAFRMQVHKQLCPSSPHSFCGFQCVAGSNKALPWKLRVFEVKPNDAKGVAEARQAVVASIDRGIPVQYGSEEDGVIVGYQKGGAEWICIHPMHAGGGKTFVEKTWPWGVGVYTERKASTPTRRELAIDALKQAVEMAHLQNREDYMLGFHAWDIWLKRLAELEKADEKTRNASMMGNSWIYTTLVEYRGVAAKYLRSVAGEFDDETAEHLTSAARLYDKMAKEVLSDRGNCALEIAPTPWYLKKGRKWTKAMRQEQVKRLKAALPLEKQAIAEIEKALAAEKTEMAVAARPAAR